MELRLVDPKTLRDNPANPRTGRPNDMEDRRLALNIKIAGLVHPPIVRALADGTLQIIAGHRRRRACIKAGMKEMPVVVTSNDAALDRLAAGSENMIRQGMSEPEQWAFVNALRTGKSMSDAQICKAMMITPAYLKQLALLARMHEPILDAIAGGYGPVGRDRATIARASREEQSAAWARIWSETVEEGSEPAAYRLTAEDGEDFDWDDLARALSHEEFFARDASFDDALARAHGIVWEEDLFGPADQDNRSTRDAGAYEAAQRAWIETQLGANDVVVDVDQYDRPELGAGRRRIWGGREDGDLAFYLSQRTLKVSMVRFERYETVERSALDGTGGAIPGGSYVAPPKPRADISGTGEKMIGEIRTQALHKALDLVRETVDPWDLVAGLLLAFTGDNVRVQGEGGGYRTGPRDRALAALFPEGVLVRDPGMLRAHAIAVLKGATSCDVSLHSGSGLPAQLLGVLFEAEAQIPSMAFDEFLKCYSKPGITKAVQDLGIAPRNTGKEMRAALLERVGPDGRWVPEAAGFGQAVDAWKVEIERRREAEARSAAWRKHDDVAGADDEPEESVDHAGEADDEEAVIGAPETTGGAEDAEDASTTDDEIRALPGVPAGLAEMMEAMGDRLQVIAVR